jgi:DinB superfamily
MTPRQHALALLTFARNASIGVMKDWPEDKWIAQSTPHDNHPIWVMGHIANTDAWIGGMIGIDMPSLPASYSTMFGMGSKPGNVTRDYPSAAELRGNFEKTRAALVAWIESASEAQLGISLSEKSGNFTSDPVDAALKSAWHEGWHFGQVATIRRALGLPSMFGG